MLIVPSLSFLKAWNRITQSFKTQDKYKGRDIHTEDLPVCLAIFRSSFTNSTRFAPAIFRLKGYRFDECSLLFLYDGDEETQQTYRRTLQDTPSRAPRHHHAHSVNRRPLRNVFV